MKHNHFKIFLFIVATCFIAGSSAYSQNKPNTPVYQTQDNIITPGKDMPQTNPMPEELKSLVQQQKAAKTNGNDYLVNSLQQQIDAFGGSVSVKAGYMDAGTGGLLHGSWHGISTDNVVETKVFTSPAGSYLKAFCTATEQRGSNIGRIWSCWAWGSTSFTSPDTLLVFYSDNGGLSWIGNSFWVPGGNAKVNYDQLDMEIMEYTTGNKYVWISGGFTNNASQQNLACIVIQTPTAGANFFSVNSWPGGATNTNVYRPRMCSDNSNYPTTSSWLFMLAARDSLNVATNQHKIGEKFVKCTNPFTTAPTMTYKGNAYGYDSYYGGTGAYYANADHCDIAYFRNGGGDSLIIVESNLPDTTVIYCNKSDENVDANSSVNFANLNGTGSPILHKQYARVTCNGDNRIMIAYRDNYNNSGDWDIRYCLSTNGGVAAASWVNGYIDSYTSTTTYPYQPDLAGLRSTSTFKCSYVYFSGGLDSAMMVSAPNGSTWGTPARTNQTNVDVSILASSRAGYRYINGDSCLTMWSEYSASGGINLWAGTGCSGTVVTEINHNGNEIPKTYSLLQNYPNPFNPTTDIKFSIPKNSLVKLTIFDITGKEVGVLVNGQLNAGNYKYNFDASNLATGVYFYKVEADGFTDVKKMMLIK